MTPTPDIGQRPAFPFVSGSGMTEESGLTIRQYYKAAALQGLLSNPAATQSWINENAAKSAARLADALLSEDSAHAARQQTKG